jgi:energy-coupling factor transporter transmembrane protein EcfT
MQDSPLHPLTWWIWSLVIAISVVRVNNAYFAIGAIAIVGFIVFKLREDAPWGKSFNWTIKVAVWILLIRTFIGISIGVPIPGNVIFNLPRIPVPSWMPGIRIGGAVTAERLSSALSEGVIICAIIVIFGAASSLTSPHRLLRILPVYIYEFATAVVIATSVLPQLVSSVARIRQAQRLRGQKTKGITSYRRLAIPLLEESLARSLDLASAMDARGYGTSRVRSRYRPINWRLRDSAVVASGIFVLVLS